MAIFLKYNFNVLEILFVCPVLQWHETRQNIPEKQNKMICFKLYKSLFTIFLTGQVLFDIFII